MGLPVQSRARILTREEGAGGIRSAGADGLRHDARSDLSSDAHSNFFFDAHSIFTSDADSEAMQRFALRAFGIAPAFHFLAVPSLMSRRRPRVTWSGGAGSVISRTPSLTLAFAWSVIAPSGNGMVRLKLP